MANSDSDFDNNKHNVLLVGCGGREHAFYDALQNVGIKEDKINTIYCYTGEVSGIAGRGIRNPAINATYINSLSDLENKVNSISFAIIGSEKFLKAGVSDNLRNMGIPVIGPSANLAQIETSKLFARKIINKLQILDTLKKDFEGDSSQFDPDFTGNFNPEYHILNKDMTVGNITLKINELLKKYIPKNIVVKTDGLAGGKGVKVGFTKKSELIEHVMKCFRDNVDYVLLEERLFGQEFTLMSFCDGNTIENMPIVVDYKVADREYPVNTGGYGSVLANPSFFGINDDDIFISHKLNKYVIDELHKTVSKSDYDKYIGILYGSYIKTKNGIKVIEYNARGGDSEIINVLDNMETPFIDVCLGMVNNKLPKITYKIDNFKIIEGKDPFVSNKNCVNVFKYYVPMEYPNPINELAKLIPIDISHFQRIDRDRKQKRLGLNSYTTGGIIISGMNCNASFFGKNISYDYCHLTGSRAIGFIGRGSSINECLKSIEELYTYFVENTKGLITNSGSPLLKSTNIVGCSTSNYNLYNGIIDDYNDYNDDTSFDNLSSLDDNDDSDDNDNDNNDDNNDDKKEMTYAKSGVDDKKVENVLKRCISAVKETHNENVGSGGSGKGGGGFFGQYEDLLTSMDGVGTKGIFTMEFSKDVSTCMKNLAQDLFYCVFNDILVGGCLEPMFFLDYFGSNCSNVVLLEPFLKHLAILCKKHNCSLVGGETAIMGDIYKENINLIGMVVGRRTTGPSEIEWSDMKEGDLIYGLPCYGPNTNGYTLIRKIVEKFKKKMGCSFYLQENAIPKSVLEQLLSSSIDYSNTVKQFGPISAMAHITGGGFNNVERVLPNGLDAIINYTKWEIPECFQWLEFIGNVPRTEMYKVFNMGIGYVVITPSNSQVPENAILIGQITSSDNTDKKGVVIMDDY